MIKTVNNKLKSNRGASMMLVLVLFLVCVMVSSIIVTAAASGGSRNVHRTKQQRAYLAVSSATDLLVEELQVIHQQNKTLEGNLNINRYGCQDYTARVTLTYFGSPVSGYRFSPSLIADAIAMDPIIVDNLCTTSTMEYTMNYKANGEVVEEDGILAALMKRAAGNVLEKGTNYSETFRIELKETDERLPAVNCSFTMDSSYSVKINVTTEGSDYAVIITSAANVQTTEKKKDDFGCSHHIYYKRYDIVTQEYVDTEQDMFIPGDSSSTITTLTWGKPKVVKGVGSE